ncbi:MAG: hypothetical protein HQ588_02645 [Deltaproteobacteria bacterium]|nr:hypothetical protein [Deltaproteobacteria bacterium]
MSERDGPILTLADKLSSKGLPSISILIAWLDNAEAFADFLNLVDEFLPERRQDILSETSPGDQISVFADYFADRYFPLDDYVRYGDAGEYEELTYRIPLTVQGISYDDYHEISSEYRAGIQLIAYLIRNPYEDLEGASVSLAEACQEHVPQELIERAAAIQLEPEEAHKLLNGTTYEQLAHWTDRLHCCTNNFFLDTDYEMLMQDIPGWDREDVEELTRQWHQAQDTENRLTEFVEWLEGDLPGRFEEIVIFILEGRANG